MEMTACIPNVSLLDHESAWSLYEFLTEIRIGDVWFSKMDPQFRVKIFSNDIRVTYYPIDSEEGVQCSDDVDGIYDEEMTTFLSRFMRHGSLCKTF